MHGRPVLPREGQYSVHIIRVQAYRVHFDACPSITQTSSVLFSDSSLVKFTQ